MKNKILSLVGAITILGSSLGISSLINTEEKTISTNKTLDREQTSKNSSWELLTANLHVYHRTDAWKIIRIEAKTRSNNLDSTYTHIQKLTAEFDKPNGEHMSVFIPNSYPYQDDNVTYVSVAQENFYNSHFLTGVYTNVELHVTGNGGELRVVGQSDFVL